MEDAANRYLLLITLLSLGLAACGTETAAEDATETTVPICIVGSPTAIECNTPCDCPKSTPVCLDGVCRSGGEFCESDWDCGCGTVCIEWKCVVPDFADEMRGMDACGCPPTFPWFDDSFKCRTKQPSAEAYFRCTCLFEWDETLDQCVPYSSGPCETSSDCQWNQRCKDQVCSPGAPACCDDDNQCPNGLVCEGMTHRCLKEAL